MTSGVKLDQGSLPAAVNSNKRKREESLERKVEATAKIEQIEPAAATLKVKQITKGPVKESQVSVEKMASKQFEGWRIKLENDSCGFVKFVPKTDAVFKKHVTVDISIPKPQQGRHIGRYALKKAIEVSQFLLFVAHLRKGNIASKKILNIVGFKESAYPGSKQLCMVYKKISEKL